MKKAGVINYTTTISVEKTLMEIQKILVDYGAVAVMTEYVDGHPDIVTFSLPNKGTGNINFRMPCHWRGVMAVMEKDKRVSKSQSNPTQARRVAWRILRSWILAQTSLVQAGLAEMPEIFLPYAVNNEGVQLRHRIFSGEELKLLR